MNMETQTAIVLFALVAALGLITVVAVDIVLTAQGAEAAKSPIGQYASTFKSRNASLVCRPQPAVFKYSIIEIYHSNRGQTYVISLKGDKSIPGVLKFSPSIESSIAAITRKALSFV